MDRHDVETTGTVCQTVAHHVVVRKSREAATLDEVDSFCRDAVRTILPRFHLYKHHRHAVAGDDVQFATSLAVPSGKNCVPAALELAAREIFAGFAQLDAGS